MRPVLAASYSQERDTPSCAATSEGFNSDSCEDMGSVLFMQS